MLGLGWFRLTCGEDGAGLVEVAAFVGGDYVDGGGERETEDTDKRIGEADCGEIEVGVGAEEILGGGVGGEESGGGVGESRSGAWLDGLRGFGFEFGGRFEGADEPAAEKTGKCGAAGLAELFGAACGVGGKLHGGKVAAICGGEMIEAFGDAPCGGMRAPGGLGFGEAGDERFGVGSCGGVSVIETFDFGEIVKFGMHRARLHTLGYGM
jgi:hypothetical protein